jgi:hypothetical protein
MIDGAQRESPVFLASSTSPANVKKALAKLEPSTQAIGRQSGLSHAIGAGIS